MVADCDRGTDAPTAPVLRPPSASSARASSASASDEVFFYYDPEDAEPFEHEELHDEDAADFQDGEDIESNLLLPINRSTQRPGVLRNMRRMFGMQTTVQADVDPADELRRRRDAGCVMTSSPSSVRESMRQLTGRPRNEDLDGVGRIEKRSPWWIEGWRPRAYVLRDRRLIYFLQDRLDRPLGVLDFNLVRFEIHCCWLQSRIEQDESRRACDVCTVPEPSDWHTLYLKPAAFPSKIFAFRGPASEMVGLAEKLGRIIASVPPSWLEERVLSLSNFWRYPQIRESDYVRRVESGDLLLFRSMDRVSKLQRAITTSSYDHVALLLRTQRDQVLVLEATGRNGVAAVPWTSFKAWGWHNCYERLVYRKVYFARSEASMVALQDFVSDNLGKPYGLTMSKLLGKQSISTSSVASNGHSNGLGSNNGAHANGDSQGTIDTECGETRTFFCSELTAACLKSCGVLDGTMDDSQYWPGTFSQYNDEPLPLHADVSIGEEQTIMYNI